MGTDFAFPNSCADRRDTLSKRRGFVYPCSEIYGGINGFWDYGPMGAELKRNVRNSWWSYMTQQREDVVGLDASIIMHPAVWKASGHVDTFADPMVDCKTDGCKGRFRIDHVRQRLVLDLHGGAVDCARHRYVS